MENSNSRVNTPADYVRGRPGATNMEPTSPADTSRVPAEVKSNVSSPVPLPSSSTTTEISRDELDRVEDGLNKRGDEKLEPEQRPEMDTKSPQPATTPEGNSSDPTYEVVVGNEYCPSSPRYSLLPDLPSLEKTVETREMKVDEDDEAVCRGILSSGASSGTVEHFPGGQGTKEVESRLVRTPAELDSGAIPSSPINSNLRFDEPTRAEVRRADGQDSIVHSHESLAAVTKPAEVVPLTAHGTEGSLPTTDHGSSSAGSVVLADFPVRDKPSQEELQRPSNLSLNLPGDIGNQTTASSSTSPSSVAPLPSPDASIHQIKWISFDLDPSVPAVPVITQNKNGPCPLISILNVLALTGRLQLPSGVEYQSAENLLSQLASCVVESVPTPDRASSVVIENFEWNVQDALAVLPKLQTGLDVNVKFSGPRQYEFTEDTLVFDVLDVPLVHGWIVEDSDLARDIVSKCATYNQLVEFIINAKQSVDEKLAQEVLLAEDWLERTSSQLTYGGLVALVECLKPDTPYVLFRNNHFSTITKHNNEIYALLTDQGYVNEPSCIWERISNIEGDTDFFDAWFKVRDEKAAPASGDYVSEPNQPGQLSQAKQMELDMLLALSLQEQPDPSPTVPENPLLKSAALPSFHPMVKLEESDYELAKRLQEEEDLALAASNVVDYPPLPAPPRSSQAIQADGEPVRAPAAWGKFNQFHQRGQPIVKPETNMLPAGVTESQSAQSFVEHQREIVPRPRVLPTSVSTNLNPSRDSSRSSTTTSSSSVHRNQSHLSETSHSQSQRTNAASSSSNTEKKCVLM